MTANTPLPITDEEWIERLRRSRQALDNWQWEAGLPWADDGLMLSIIDTELATLRHYVPFMPVRMRGDVAPLLHDWGGFRLMLMERQ